MAEISAARRFIALLRTNWLSWAGAILTTVSFISMVSCYVLISMGEWSSPYIGMVAFLVLPTCFVAGLVLIPVGLFLYRAKLSERMELVTQKPIRLLRAIGILTAINIAAVGIAGYQGVHYMDSVKFCGTVCHEVMQPQYDAYLASPHARVACVDCHIGPGASWFVKSKLSGLRQVFAVMFDTFERPTPVPVKDLRPARETCEQCHWPEKFTADRLVFRQHYREDEKNTPYANVLVMKTGGTRPDGTATGIHWHVHRGMDVQYYATDEKRTDIPWVRLVDHETGAQEVFVREGVSEEPPPGAEIRTMDCIDCHNQPSHKIERADVALDAAIHDGLISPELPWVRKLGLELLRTEWTREGVEAGMRQRLEDACTGERAIPDTDRPLLEKAARELSAIWLRNNFPDMRVGWDTYPSMVGHFGCRRCHTVGAAEGGELVGTHRTAEGKSIPVDCDVCHVILAREQEDPEILRRLGLAQVR